MRGNCSDWSGNIRAVVIALGRRNGLVYASGEVGFESWQQVSVGAKGHRERAVPHPFHDGSRVSAKGGLMAGKAHP